MLSKCNGASGEAGGISKTIQQPTDVKTYAKKTRHPHQLPTTWGGGASSGNKVGIQSYSIWNILYNITSFMVSDSELWWFYTNCYRAARSLGERSVTELILQHQNPQQLSANLWAAVRTRGCQFLGPAMQEEVLKLVLLALEDGSALSRKVLVMFVVQKLEPSFPQASKTSIGHVVQLLYRASCFKVCSCMILHKSMSQKWNNNPFSKRYNTF